MSLYDYKRSQHIAALDEPFYALIMAAMRQADTGNELALRSIFPEVWSELKARYHAPGGWLPRDDNPPTIVIIEDDPDITVRSAGMTKEQDDPSHINLDIKYDFPKPDSIELPLTEIVEPDRPE